MEEPLALADRRVLRLWAPGPAEVRAETVAVLVDVPALPVCQAAARVDGDELVCGDGPIPRLSPQEVASVRRTAAAINGLQHGQLCGALMLVATIRPESLRAALEGMGWPVPEEEDPWIPDPLPGRRRRPSAVSADAADPADPEPTPPAPEPEPPAPPPEPEPASAPLPESADPEPTPPPAAADRRDSRAAILAAVEDFAADPAGALAMIAEERERIGPQATAASLGLSCYRALGAVSRRLQALADLQERFSDEGRRRWLLRQAVEVQERGGDPVAVFARQAGTTRGAAATVLRGLGVKVARPRGCSSSDRATA